MTLDDVLKDLKAEPRRWLVTGVAGFIGSHLLETLLGAGQSVTGLDNFSTGHRSNLEDVRDLVGPEAWSRFTLLEGDVRSLEDCRRAAEGAEFVLHEAALASVPESIKDPIAANQSNIDGFLNLLVASRDHGARRFMYATSSAVYGNDPGQPKREEMTGQPLSPYALTKLVNEQYATLFGSLYGLETIGLRYFNVFGRRQDPRGPYAAVIPLWVEGLLRQSPCTILGDGATTRDFCHVRNIVHANLLAALAGPQAANQVYNVACGERTTLLELEALLRELLSRRSPAIASLVPRFGPPREGDVRHSQADISKAARLLGYAPQIPLRAGLEEAMTWYCDHL